MADSSLAALRAQIKSWERQFRAEHDRDPLIDDVKQRPDILKLYKQHKLLQKTASSASTSNPEPTPPLQGFNPFSPTKKKNRPRRSPSPDPFHSRPITTPVRPNPALSRARKRFRGESVSPSPSKGKRQRSSPLQSPECSDSSDEDQPPLPAALPFLLDSPVKAPSGNKSFKLLFQDPLPRPSFPSSSEHVPAPDHKQSSQRHSHSNNRGARSKTAFLARFPITTKNDLFANRTSDNDSSTSDFLSASAGRSQNKRSYSTHARDEEDSSNILSDNTQTESNGDPSPRQQQLLRPSPPPDPARKTTMHAKANAQASGSKSSARSRKKPRTGQATNQDDEDSLTDADDIHVRLINPSAQHRPQRNEDSDDPDLLLLPRDNDKRGPRDEDDQDQFVVDIPDDMLSVLSISGPSRSQVLKEEKLYRGLVYGRREEQYNGARGGEIWDVGEEPDDVEGGTEGEDDWEGEPIPWEVGEL